MMKKKCFLLALAALLVISCGSVSLGGRPADRQYYIHPEMPGRTLDTCFTSTRSPS